MATQTKLCTLVDLALRDPEVGAVNFNQLRTLLLSILKFTNISEMVVEKEITAKTIVSNTSQSHSKTSEDVAKQDHKGGLDHKERDMSVVPTNIGVIKPLASLLSKQNDLEERLVKVENVFNTNTAFPTNEDILNKRVKTEDASTFSTTDDVTQVDHSKLRTIWQNKRCLRRLDEIEEAIDKSFSLINDILNHDKLNEVQDEVENPQNQLIEIQNRFDQHINDDNSHYEDMQKNKELIDQVFTKVENLSNIVNENITKTNVNNNLIAKIKNQRTDSKVNTSGNYQAQNMELEERLNELVSQMNNKVDSSELDTKFHQFYQDQKDIDTGTGRSHSEIDRLNEVIGELQRKIIAPSDNIDSDRPVILDEHSVPEDDLSALRKELSEIKLLKEKLDVIEDKTNNDGIKSMMQKVLNENLQKCPVITNIKGEIDVLTGQLQGIMSQLEQKEQKFDDLKAMVKTLTETPMQAPEIDTSVLAAVHNLAQENRQQITIIHENIKVYKKRQSLSAAASTDNKIDGNVSIEMLEGLQNDFMLLQETQVKQSGHISIMTDDYKTEFQRKQLHIDALYDYIEKLQREKATKEDIVTVELNIKENKQELDNRVNLTTFDQRYYALEVTLQEALSRLEQYADEENSLKAKLSELSEDVNTKMDTDTGKKLKRFLNERLKEIQESRSHLQGASDIRTSAAGLRKVMPFSCLSCDKDIDVTTNGITASIPYNMPWRIPLLVNKNEKRLSYSSYNSFAASRPCGGSHTSININSLRAIKMLPSQNESMVADGIIGTDRQVYHGRLNPLDFSNTKEVDRNDGKARSPRSLAKCNCTSKLIDRPHSVTREVQKEDKNKHMYFPMINNNINLTKTESS